MISENYAVKGKSIPRNRLPPLLFGNKLAISYAHNPKSGCTLARHILFFLNHGYHYIDDLSIHRSAYAFWKIQDPSTANHQEALNKFNELDPKIFSFVRDPIERFLSAFRDKIWKSNDKDFFWYRDNLTSNFGVDLSPTANFSRSCEAFVDYMVEHIDPLQMDQHFRPQFLNLAQDYDLPLHRILKLENQNECVNYFSDYASLEVAKSLFERKINPSNREPNLIEQISNPARKKLHAYYEVDYINFYS